MRLFIYLRLFWYESTEVNAINQLSNMRRDTQTLLNSQHQLLQLLNQTGMFQLAKLWQNISDML